MIGRSHPVLAAFEVEPAGRLQRRRDRPDLRRPRRGPRARLPLHPGHQLRPRPDGRRSAPRSSRCSSSTTTSTTTSRCSPSLVVGGALGAVIELVVVRRLFTAPRVILFVATLGVTQLLLLFQSLLPRLDGVRAVPDPVRRPSGRSARSSCGARTSWCWSSCPSLTVAARALPQAHEVRHRDPRRGRQPRRGPHVGDQRQDDVDARVGPRRAARHRHRSARGAPAGRDRRGHAGARPERSSCEPSPPRSSAACSRCRSRSSAASGSAWPRRCCSTTRPTTPGLIDAILFVVVLVAVLAGRRSGRDDEGSKSMSFSPRTEPVPAALQRLWVVRRLRRSAWSSLRRRASLLPLVFSRVVDAAHAVADAAVRGRRAVAHAAHRLGRAAVARSVRVRRPRARCFTASLVRGHELRRCSERSARARRRSRSRSRWSSRSSSAPLVAMVVGIAGAARPRAVPRRHHARVRGDGPELAVRAAVPARRGVHRPPRPAGLARTTSAPTTTCASARSSSPRSCSPGSGAAASGARRSAVRDNEQGAAAFTISPTRTKLTAFGVSGALAGLAGGLLAGLQVQFGTDTFPPRSRCGSSPSRSSAGCRRSPAPSSARCGSSGSRAARRLRDVAAPHQRRRPADPAPLLPARPRPARPTTSATSSSEMLARRLPRAGGREAARAPRSRRGSSTTPTSRRSPAGVPGAPRRRRHACASAARRGRRRRPRRRAGRGRRPHRHQRRRQVDADERGRGLRAVAGTIEILGQDATTLSAAAPGRRSASGATFQSAELFPDLTRPRDHPGGARGAGRATLPAPCSRCRGRGGSSGASAPRPTSSSPSSGSAATRTTSSTSSRPAPAASSSWPCLIAVEARVLCLDEPTAGVAQRETEAFAPLVLRIREELGASVLVVEHDMPFIMGISDRVYCLEAGRIIAEGAPAADPRRPGGHQQLPRHRRAGHRTQRHRAARGQGRATRPLVI